MAIHLPQYQISIPDEELEMTFVRSSGPGGQNVNKVASKAVLRFAVASSPTVPDDVRQRFVARYASRLTNTGEIVISSQRYRDQGRNAADARSKLAELLASVAVAPKKRRPTKPSRSSVARRVESKQARSKTKKLRGRVREE